MPLYMIERNFAEQLDLTDDDIKLIEEINADEGVRWLFSFLSADRRRTYCLYEAPSPEAIVAAAKRANVPADEIVEVEQDTLGSPAAWRSGPATSRSPRRSAGSAAARRSRPRRLPPRGRRSTTPSPSPAAAHLELGDEHQVVRLAVA